MANQPSPRASMSSQPSPRGTRGRELVASGSDPLPAAQRHRSVDRVLAAAPQQSASPTVTIRTEFMERVQTIAQTSDLDGLRDRYSAQANRLYTAEEEIAAGRDFVLRQEASFASKVQAVRFECRDEVVRIQGAE
jgi:hypothetical protein